MRFTLCSAEPRERRQVRVEAGGALFGLAMHPRSAARNQEVRRGLARESAQLPEFQSSNSSGNGILNIHISILL